MYGTGTSINVILMKTADQPEQLPVLYNWHVQCTCTIFTLGNRQHMYRYGACFRYIVSTDWSRKSSEVGSWLPEQDFLLKDPEVPGSRQDRTDYCLVPAQLIFTLQGGHNSINLTLLFSLSFKYLNCNNFIFLSFWPFNILKVCSFICFFFNYFFLVLTIPIIINRNWKKDGEKS